MMKITDAQCETLVDTIVNLIICRDDSVRNYKNSFHLFDAYCDELMEECDDIFSAISERDNENNDEYWQTMNFLFDYVYDNYRRF